MYRHRKVDPMQGLKLLANGSATQSLWLPRNVLNYLPTLGKGKLVGEERQNMSLGNCKWLMVGRRILYTISYKCLTCWLLTLAPGLISLGWCLMACHIVRSDIKRKYWLLLYVTQNSGGHVYRGHTGRRFVT